MDLYINGKKCYLGEEFTPNFSYRFLDTFDPSSVKSGYSKTVTLPDCPENSLVLVPFQEKYDFTILDNNIVREKGYCILDSTEEAGFKREYHLTLYGELGNFFSNLKGTEAEPKTLCDIPIFRSSLEGDFAFTQSLTPAFVYRGWNSTGSVSDILKLVPCTWKVDGFDYEKTIVDNRPDPWGVGTSGSYWVGGYPSLLVTAEENTPHGRRDFRVGTMPIAIRYKNIIEGCCSTQSNGGYKVNLDPDFFNDDNPYWTDTYLMNKVPSLKTLEDPEKSQKVAYLLERGMDAGLTGSIIRTPAPVLPASSSIWTEEGNYIVTSASLVENIFTVTVTPYVPCSGSAGMPAFYFWAESMSFSVGVDNDDDPTRSKTVYWTKADQYYHPGGPVDGFILPSKTISFSVPREWNRVRVRYQTGWPGSTPSTWIHYRGQGAVPMRVTSSVIIPGIHDIGFSGEGKLSTTYLTPEASTLINPVFSKQAYLSNTKSPLDYLLSYAKMFNLRFWVHPGAKEVDVLTFENFLRASDPENIDDRIDYSKAYIETSNLINESIINFNLEPEPNRTIKKYFDEEGQNILDRRVKVKKEGGVKDYIGSSVLKVGSRSRQESNYGAMGRVQASTLAEYDYYGFMQRKPYTLGLVSGSGQDFAITNLEITPFWSYGPVEFYRYDFLEVEDPSDVIVMYAGTAKAEPVSWNGYNLPVIISTTSKDMLHYAGKPCFLSGIRENDSTSRVEEGSTGTICGCRYKATYNLPIFSLTPNYPSYLNGLSFANENYDSIQVGSNLFDNYFKDFIDKVYINPKKVTCWVRLNSPDLRKLYYFNNAYWILTEVSDYNYNDDPVQCTFVRYCK